MSAISTLKRSTSTIYYHRLSSIRRHSSLPHPPHPTPIASTANSVSKYLATIAAGSSLGFLFLSSSSGSDSNNKSWPSYLSKPSIVFADWSTASEESVKVGDDKSFSSKFLQKLSLPDYSSKFIFKGDLFIYFYLLNFLVFWFSLFSYWCQCWFWMFTCLIEDSFRRKVFFNYEKRIRLRSPPEKVTFVICFSLFVDIYALLLIDKVIKWIHFIGDLCWVFMTIELSCIQISDWKQKSNDNDKIWLLCPVFIYRVLVTE